MKPIFFILSIYPLLSFSQIRVDSTFSKDSTSWTYSIDTDLMTSKPSFLASVLASDELKLNAPYDQGWNFATLILRNIGGKNSAVLFIQQGQFMPDINGEIIKIRFDNDQPLSFVCVGSQDEDSRYLFFISPNRMISKLKKAHNIIVEAMIYDNGNQQMVFKVNGLKWDH